MQIVHYPHPALLRPTTPVRGVDKRLRLQIGEMFDLMYAARGLGLAANQVGLPYQLVVLNVTGNPNAKEQERIYLNPRIVEQAGVVTAKEGCLSFPGLFCKVERAEKVVVHATGLDGNAVTLTAVGIDARAWQHEMEHLNGKLFIDRFPWLSRLLRRGDIRGFENAYRKSQATGALASDEEIGAMLDTLERAMRGA